MALVAFYKEKQKRLGKNEENFVAAITISPAEGALTSSSDHTYD